MVDVMITNHVGVIATNQLSLLTTRGSLQRGLVAVMIRGSVICSMNASSFQSHQYTDARVFVLRIRDSCAFYMRITHVRFKMR